MKNITLSVGLLLVFASALYAQDNIILRNGQEIKAKVEEVGVAEIKYRKPTTSPGLCMPLISARYFLFNTKTALKMY